MGVDYIAAVNGSSCPGWSYYGSNTGGPRVEFPGVNDAVIRSGGPAWASPEFLFLGRVESR